MKKYTYIIGILAIAFIGILPLRASAATVYLESSRNEISVGDTVIVSAKINAQGVTINTVEGDITLKSGGTSVAVQEFSLANSSFGLWPRTPSLSKDGQVISFVAGVPGGFNIEGATLFKIIFEAKKEGVITISPQNIAVYASDGKGTKLPVDLKNITLKVVAKKTGVATTDEWKALIAQDTVPPEDFIVVLGQDKALFDGKKFAFFSALDNQSGVSYYEVSEKGGAPVRSGSMYVLQDQTGDVVIDVTAFDKAGNKKSAHYPTSSSFFAGVSWMTVIVAVIILLVVWFVYRTLRKKRRNASQ